MQEKQKTGKQLFEKGEYDKTKIGWDRCKHTNRQRGNWEVASTKMEKSKR